MKLRRIARLAGVWRRMRSFGIVALLCLAVGHVAPAAELQSGQVRAMLLAGEFAELTQLFVALDKEYAEKSLSVWKIEGAYAELRTSDPAVTDAIDRWIAAEPGSYPAHIAKAVQIAHIGRLMRGRDIGVYQGGPAPQAALEFELAGVRELNKIGRIGAESPVAFAESLKSFIPMGKNDAVNDIIQQRWSEGRGSALDYQVFARSLEPWFLNIGATWDEALAKLKQYLRIVDEDHGADPEFDWIDGYYDYVAAEVTRRRGDFRAAVAGFSQAIAAQEQPDFYFGRGVAYIQMDDGERALADLDAALRLDPDFGDAYS
jgi:tetratricopeptide (TPR) repeat protein